MKGPEPQRPGPFFMPHEEGPMSFTDHTDDGIERPDEVALMEETGTATDDDLVGDWTGADDDTSEEA